MMKMPPQQAQSMTQMALPTMAAMDVDQLLAVTRQAMKAQPALGGDEMAKALEEGEKIEPYVMVPLMTAYMSGANFISTVRRGGWDAVDKLYDAPPVSTEQCLHPEKYAKKPDLPTPMVLPDMPEIVAAGWREADSAVQGELYFRVLLKRNGATPAASTRAAAGWDGDFYRSWRNADGSTAIVLATTWDTEKDAKEFFDAYKAALPKKYPKLAAEASPAPVAAAKPATDGPEAPAAAPAAAAGEPNAFLYACGDAPLGAGELLLRGREVFAVEGFSAELRAQVAGKLAATTVEHIE
jgi:hypothetical protein